MSFASSVPLWAVVLCSLMLWLCCLLTYMAVCANRNATTQAKLLQKMDTYISRVNVHQAQTSAVQQILIDYMLLGKMPKLNDVLPIRTSHVRSTEIHQPRAAGATR